MIHLVKSFTNYSVNFFCGKTHIDFRAFYLDKTHLDSGSDTQYTDTTSKADCKECLERAKPA